MYSDIIMVIVVVVVVFLYDGQLMSLTVADAPIVENKTVGMSYLYIIFLHAAFMYRHYISTAYL